MIDSRNHLKVLSIKPVRIGLKQKLRIGFFKNECVDAAKILEAHASKTAERAKKEKVILAVQDTSCSSNTHCTIFAIILG